MRALSLDSPAAPSGPRRRDAASVSGHFGEILQGRLGRDGPVALLTLPAPGVRALSAEAVWRPAVGAPLLTRGPGLRDLAADALRAGLRERARLGWGGRLDIETRARPGGGCGASTASLLAALRLAAPGLRPAREAALLLALEGAVDPLMLAEPGRALWASRRGRVLRRLRSPPALLVVGGYDGPGRRTDPSDDDFADVSDLVGLAAAAARAGDAAGFAAVATLSAERRQRIAPTRRFKTLQRLGAEFRALGIVVAHTGSAMGLLFDPRRGAPASLERRMNEAGLEKVIRFKSG